MFPLKVQVLRSILSVNDVQFSYNRNVEVKYLKAYGFIRLNSKSFIHIFQRLILKKKKNLIPDARINIDKHFATYNEYVKWGLNCPRVCVRVAGMLIMRCFFHYSIRFKSIGLNVNLRTGYISIINSTSVF